MTALVATELLKLRTTPSGAAAVGAAAALGAAMAALIALLSSADDISGESGGRLILSSGGIAAGIVALLWGIATVAGEYRHGTILTTLLVTPARPRVMLAQTLALAVAGLVIGAVSVAVTTAAGLLSLAARDVPPASTGVNSRPSSWAASASAACPARSAAPSARSCATRWSPPDSPCSCSSSSSRSSPG